MENPPHKKWYQHTGIIVILFFSLAAVAVVFASGKISGPKAEEKSPKSKACEMFISGIAQAFAQPNLCKKVSLDIVGTAAFNSPGLQISYERSECFDKVAEETGDESLCAEVRPVSIKHLNGSKLNESYCVNNIEQAKKNNIQHGGSVPFYQTDAELTPIMDQLGYTKSSALASPTWNDYINNLALLWISNKNNVEAVDFLNKVGRIECGK